MTPAEAQVLLSMCATVDNRKPDEDAARSWAALLDGLRVEDCIAAIKAHYSESTAWLMPAEIRTRVRRLRAKRIESHPPLVPPAGLTDAEERKWIAAARRRIGDGEKVADPRAIDARPRDMRALMGGATRD